MRLSHAHNTLGTGLILICLLLALGARAQSTAATPIPPAQLIEDIDLAVDSGADLSPSEFVALGTTTFFTAEDETNGIELWKTDGTTAGTTLVRDMTPGPLSSFPSFLTALNTTLLFFTHDDLSIVTLWRSDGTAQGTTPVTTILGSVGSAVVVNGAFVYTASASNGGMAVYRSDGTAAGTVELISLTSIDGSFVVAGNTAFFAGTDTATGSELWKTDGTATGTMLVHDIVPGSGSSSPAQLTAVGANIFFTAATAYDRTLWKSDGSDAGTTLVSASDGTTFAHLNSLVAVDNQLFFWSTRNRPFPPIYEVSLWKSDGTTAGTVQVKIVDTPDEFNDQTGYQPAASNHKLFFAIRGTLWASDGSESGTTVVKAISAANNASLNDLTDLKGTLFFAANDGSANLALWKSDGSAAGTVPATSGASNAPLGNPRELTVVGNHLFLSIDTDSGAEPWISDGTSAGTFQLKDINADGVSSFAQWEQQNGADDGSLAGTVAYKGALFFSASDYNTLGNGPSGLWKTDGTASNTTLVKAFSGDNIDKWLPFNLTVVGDTLFFATNSVNQGWSLWKSDGTEGGTVLLKQDGVSAPSQYPLNQFVSANGKLFFVAIAPGLGYSLWQSDGTSNGTTVVKGGHPTDTDASSFKQLTVVGNSVFFIVTMPDHDELWKSDGTNTGTVLVKQFDNKNPLYDSYPRLLAVGNTLFFTGSDAVHGAELWTSDGTESGTALVKDINPGGADSHPTDFVTLNNTLYFTANDGIYGSALWKSDGTSVGTMLVSDINPDTGDTNTILDPQSFGNMLLFLGNDRVHGYELWKSDGTEAGTTLVKDFVPGPVGSLPYSLQVSPLPDGKHALINAYTPDKGIELWITDGTPNGTILVQDIAPGPASAAPATFTTIGKRVFFTADDTVHGRELWSLNTDDVSTAQIQVFLPIVVK